MSERFWNTHEATSWLHVWFLLGVMHTRMHCAVNVWTFYVSLFTSTLSSLSSAFIKPTEAEFCIFGCKTSVRRRSKRKV